MMQQALNTRQQPVCRLAGLGGRRRESRSWRAPICSPRSCRSPPVGRWKCTSTRTGSCTTWLTLDAELDEFAQIYLDVLRRFDRMYSGPLPYISALHQYADTEAQREGYFHVELMSIRRSAAR